MIKKCLMFVFIVLVLLFIGCGGGSQERAAEKAAEKAIAKETGEKADVDISKDKVMIKSEGKEITIAGEGTASLPEDFPKDIYVYPGAGIKMSGKQENSFMLTLESKDDLKKVVSEYKDKMKAQEWKEKTTLDMGEQTMIEFEKENRSTIINITKADDKTQIHIMINTEEKK